MAGSRGIGKRYFLYLGILLLSVAFVCVRGYQVYKERRTIEQRIAGAEAFIDERKEIYDKLEEFKEAKEDFSFKKGFLDNVRKKQSVSRQVLVVLTKSGRPSLRLMSLHADGWNFSAQIQVRDSTEFTRFLETLKESEHIYDVSAKPSSSEGGRMIYIVEGVVSPEGDG